MNWELIGLFVLALLCVIMWVRVVLLMIRQPDEPKHDPDFLSWRQMKQAWKELKTEKNT